MKTEMITAQKPPMGWNSFICYGWSVTEKEMKENIDYAAGYLKPYGWEYMIVDFCWACPGANCDPNPNQDKTFSPWLHMDEYGRLLPDEGRFPSSADGMGFGPLAAYTHAKGLKFGIHIMRGIPRQAAAADTPVYGSDKTAADIADKDSVCEWLNYMYGVDMDKEGAQEYLDSLLELYASWGIDFIKIDDLSYPYHKKEIEGYKKAADRTGREIVISTSPGETPLHMADHIRSYANMWRISKDFWDNWDELKQQFRRFREWTPYRSEGRWPDGDMLPLGHISLRGPMGEPRYSLFTDAEQETMMSLWAMAKSPLMMGGNLPDNTPQVLRLLTNEMLIKIDQESRDNREVMHDEKTAVWSAQHPEGELYLAVFNLTEKEELLSFELKNLGAVCACDITDVWSGEYIGRTDTFRGPVKPHGVRLLVLKQPDSIGKR